jgi:hypothetical protein
MNNIEIKTVEKILPDFINENWLIEPEYYNYRINYNGQRFYARCYENRLENGEIEYNVLTAPSFSAIYNKVVPLGYGLQEWYKNLTKEQIEFNSHNSAIYGTIFHILCGRILRGEKILVDELYINTEIERYCQEEDENLEDLKKWIKNEKRRLLLDLLAFTKWIKDFKVIPIAIEYPVFSDKCAGTIDLIAKIIVPLKYTKDELVEIAMKKYPIWRPISTKAYTSSSESSIRKLTKEQIIEKCDIKRNGEYIALIDLKSGQKGFWETNAMQLYQYAKCWNEEYPDLKITKLFNYGCDNYRLPNVKYRFKDQTDNKKIFKKWDKYVEIYYVDEPSKPEKMYELNSAEYFDPEKIDDLVIEFDPLQRIIEIIKGEKEKEEF